jgi:hypothetical protein
MTDEARGHDNLAGHAFAVARPHEVGHALGGVAVASKLPVTNAGDLDVKSSAQNVRALTQGRGEGRAIGQASGERSFVLDRHECVLGLVRRNPRADHEARAGRLVRGGRGYAGVATVRPIGTCRGRATLRGGVIATTPLPPL